jgi:hypothetical protein
MNGSPHLPTNIRQWFGDSRGRWEAVLQSASFLYFGVPVFEIRDTGGATDLLVRNSALAKALAATLGSKPIAVDTRARQCRRRAQLKRATIRAIYTEVNARLHTIALGLGGPINYLSPEEDALRDKNPGEEGRAWDGWKDKAMRK